MTRITKQENVPILQEKVEVEKWVPGTVEVSQSSLSRIPSNHRQRVIPRTPAQPRLIFSYNILNQKIQPILPGNILVKEQHKEATTDPVVPSTPQRIFSYNTSQQKSQQILPGNSLVTPRRLFSYSTISRDKTGASKQSVAGAPLPWMIPGWVPASLRDHTIPRTNKKR